MLPEFNKKHPGMRRKILSPFLFNINPNILSFLGFLSAAASGYFFYNKDLLLGALFVLLNGFLDILDGEVARKFKRSSRRGDFLDHFLDRLSDISIFLGITFSGIVEYWIGVLGMVLTFLISYLGTQAQAVSGKRFYGGIIGRADRLLIIAVISIFGYFDLRIFYWGFIAVVFLSGLTVVQRFLNIYRKI